jgi:YD repeat-containing protein
MPISVTDPRNYTTNTTYDINDLFPYKIQQPTTNGIQHIDYYSYDYNTGNLLWHTDQNGSGPNGSGPDDPAHTTQYTYNDPFGRLTKVVAPPTPEGQGETDICYKDGTWSSCNTFNVAYDNAVSWAVTTSVKASPNQSQVSGKGYDSFGRLVQTQLPNGATTETTYDVLGRTASVSNPHFGGAVAYTTYAYDALNRMLYKCNQDNGTGSSPCVPGASYQQWSYLGNVTTFYDELRNPWQRTSDALGRLKQVVEPGVLTTLYVYDALNNLLSVNQLGNAANGDTPRTRSFSYDSLSRLLTAFNPETGTVHYTYDANSNVWTKTDARSMTTTYSYDALNRLLSKTYSDATTSATPISCYQYDTSSATPPQGIPPNWFGRLTNAWTMRASASCATTAPSTGFLTKRSILAYDAMGRIRNEQQFTKASQASGAIYAPAYTYDLAGNPLTSTNGVGPATATPAAPSIALTYTLDNAGHLQSLNSSLLTANINQTTYNYPALLFSPPTVQSTPCLGAVTTQYTPFGGLEAIS